MIRNAFLTFNSLRPSIKAFLSPILAITAFTIGALLQSRIQTISGSRPEDLPWGLFWILLLLALAVGWGGLRYWYHRTIQSVVRVSEAQQRSIADARERLTTLNVEQLARCDKTMEDDGVSIDELRSTLICELDRISGLIKAAWEVVNSHHNVSVSAIERINFEMTLISPSFHDSELTIAAWCNRDNLRPKSLTIRLTTDPQIFRRTEAAKMIARSMTETLVIEDTSSPSENYEPLYEGQKARIRSSVLHPILSPKGAHLGVLVLHCERPGFFQQKDRRYWHELFAVFGPSIALELERIKVFNKAATDWPSAPVKPYEPY